jgi:hypothetical protein
VPFFRSDSMQTPLSSAANIDRSANQHSLNRLIEQNWITLGIAIISSRLLWIGRQDLFFCFT